MKNLKHLFLLLLISLSVQGQSRSEIQTQIETIATGIPNTALKVRTVLAVIADGTAQTGDVKEIDVTNAYLTANFDATGLGKNERLGWAICNGNNGTRNRSGRVGIQYSSSTYPTLGITGGEVTHVLTVTEMPSHNHTVYVNSGSGGAISGVEDAVSSGTTVTSSFSGGGQAHNNMQPYIVSLYIMKL